MNFGKSKAKAITKDMPQTTFEDVAGSDEAVEELVEIKDFLPTLSVSRKWGEDPQGCCSTDLRVRARPSSRVRWQVKRAPRSTRFPVRTSWKCLSVLVRAVSETSSSKQSECAGNHLHR